VRAEHDLELRLDESARSLLLEWCTADLANGGRGIGNQLECCFINPLARALFLTQLELSGHTLQVSAVSVHENVYSIELTQ
jgi:hypothetical protein